jgi:hypothetical protein
LAPDSPERATLNPLPLPLPLPRQVPAASALDGYEDVQPMVYCGLFPTDADDYQVGGGIMVLGGLGAVVGG